LLDAKNDTDHLFGELEVSGIEGAGHGGGMFEKSEVLVKEFRIGLEVPGRGMGGEFAREAGGCSAENSLQMFACRVTSIQGYGDDRGGEEGLGIVEGGWNADGLGVMDPMSGRVAAGTESPQVHREDFVTVKKGQAANRPRERWKIFAPDHPAVTGETRKKGGELAFEGDGKIRSVHEAYGDDALAVPLEPIGIHALRSGEADECRTRAPGRVVGPCEKRA
jgi:hypothetical protein